MYIDLVELLLHKINFGNLKKFDAKNPLYRESTVFTPNSNVDQFNIDFFWQIVLDAQFDCVHFLFLIAKYFLPLHLVKAPITKAKLEKF